MGNTTAGNGTALPDDPGVFGSISEWFNAPDNVILARIIVTVLTLVLAWGTGKLVQRGLEQSARRMARMRRFDEYKTKVVVGRTKPLRMTIKIGLFTVAFLTIFGIWGLTGTLGTLLAGAGFAGIVIGLAAADTIGDVIAGFLIFYNHPFDLGDWVEVDGIQGIVEDVALGATTVITFDNEKVTIPNRLVEGQKIKNFTGQKKLRFRVPVGVEYGTSLGRAMQTLVELGREHPDVLKDPEPMAVSAGFGASSVDLELRVWVEPIRNSVIKVRTDLIHMIHDRFKKDGIKIAFPHMQVVQGKPWIMDSETE